RNSSAQGSALGQLAKTTGALKGRYKFSNSSWLPVMKFVREKEVVERAVEIAVSQGNVVLAGDLAIPKAARGLVIFAHGSGSSRHSSRNRFVAKTLREAGLATLLFDLLTEEEERE